MTVASDSNRVTGVVSLSVTTGCDTRSVRGKVPIVSTRKFMAVLFIAKCVGFSENPSSDNLKCTKIDNYPLGTVRPMYRTGVSLLSRERFLYI